MDGSPRNRPSRSKGELCQSRWCCFRTRRRFTSRSSPATKSVCNRSVGRIGGRSWPIRCCPEGPRAPAAPAMDRSHGVHCSTAGWTTNETRSHRWPLFVTPSRGRVATNWGRARTVEAGGPATSAMDAAVTPPRLKLSPCFERIWPARDASPDPIPDHPTRRYASRRIG